MMGSDYISILYSLSYVYEMHTKMHAGIFFGIVLLKYSLFQVFFATSPPVTPLCFHPCRRCLFDSRAVSVEMQVG